MKNPTRWLALVALLLSLTCMLCACDKRDGASGGEKDDANPTTPTDDDTSGTPDDDTSAAPDDTDETDFSGEEKPPIPSEGLEYALNQDGTGYLVRGIGTCTDSNLVIPSTYRDLPVTGFSVNVFAYCKNITSVTIPDSIVEINRGAFGYCESLTSVTIPNSVTSIGTETFYGCKSLTDITIPESVTRIGDSAFWGCKSLNAVYITDLASWCAIDFVDGYDSNPLYLAQQLYIDGVLATAITIPDCVTSISDYAFNGYSALTSVTIPDSVTSIGRRAFNDCDGITDITVPDSVTSIGESAFSGFRSLAYNEYDNAYYVGNQNHPYLVLVKVTSKEITSCEINEHTKLICEGAFGHCYELTSITIPDGVTSIGDYAFSYTDLTFVTIPDSVQTIGSGAFNILSVVCYGGMESEWSEITIGYNRGLEYATIYYYSETEPTGSGNYWHYVDGVPTLW